MPIWEVDPARPHRGPDRVPARLLDRAPAAHRAFPRHLHARQDVRGADPARRHPGHLQRLLRQADAHRAGAALRSSARAASCSASSGVPAGRRDRRGAARLHQGRAVRDADAHRRHAHRRRHRAARSSTACSSPCATTDAMDYPPCARLQDRPVPVPGADPRRVALGRDHRRRHAARHRQALGGGVLVLPRHADHGRRLRLRPLQELVDPASPTT